MGHSGSRAFSKSFNQLLPACWWSSLDVWRHKPEVFPQRSWLDGIDSSNFSLADVRFKILILLLKESVPTGIPILLCANKIDLRSQLEQDQDYVTSSEGAQLASVKICFFFCICLKMLIFQNLIKIKSFKEIIRSKKFRNKLIVIV